MKGASFLRLKSLLLAGLLALLCSAPASASEVEAAEHQRLQAEMLRLASRNAWQGVEQNFEELLTLQDRGEVLTVQDWMLGVHAARGIGNMTACRHRLVMGLEIQANEESQVWLTQIDDTYAQVTLSADRVLSPTLSPAVMPFIPDQRKAIEWAQGQVAESRDFEGLLPAGTYSYGEESFEVVGGGEALTVHLDAPVIERSADQPFGLSYAGPRVNLGAVLTQGGEASEEGAPPAFGGAGIRASLGLEVGLNPRLGLFAEVGYHGLRSVVDRSDSAALEAVGQFSGSLLRTGFLALGPTYRLGRFRLSGGPVFAVGTARAAADEPSDDGPSVWVTQGTMAALGGEAGVGFAVLPIGTALETVVSLNGGAQTDSQRWYPWAQFALCIGPRPEASR